MDDLSDLTFVPSSAPAAATAQRPAGRSAFDYLSSGGHFANPPRASPSTSPRPTGSFSSNPAPRPSPTATVGATDAFGSLFDDGSGAQPRQGSVSGLSMAEQLASQQSTFGGLFPTQAGSGRGTPVIRSSSPGLLAPTRAATTSRSGSPAVLVSSGARATSPLSTTVTSKPSTSDPWDFDMLSSASSPALSPSPAAVAPVGASQTTASKRDSWGIEFDPVPAPPAAAHSSPPRRETRPTGIALGQAGDEGDNLLGDLGKPVDAAAIRRQAASLLQAEANRQHRQSRHPPSSPPTRSPALNGAGGRISPPPHVLGQVVEMGFGIAEAKRALVGARDAAGGWNVEAAVASLVGGAGPSELGDGDVIRPPPQDHRARTGRERSYSGSDDDPVLQRRPSPPRNARRQVTTDRPPSSAPSPALSGTTKEFQDQASVLYAQASAYGISALGKASAFWKQGRAAIEKALEEREGDSSASESGPVASGSKSRFGRAEGGVKEGRPKWMRDAELAAQEDGSPPRSRKPMSFRDEDRDDDSGGEQSRRPPVLNGRVDAARSPAPVAPRREPSPDLFGAAPAAPPRPAPTSAPPPREAYVSSARRKNADRSNRHAPVVAAASAPSRPPQSRPARQLPAASAGELASSLAHREKGNEAFKRGQFGDAETAYSRALDALPEGCWERVVVWNNRALARLKNGDGRGVSEDTTAAVAMIVGVVAAEPGKTLDLTSLEVDAAAAPNGVDLRDQLGKALSRRARSAEARERWTEASSDWEAVRAAGEAVVRSAGGVHVVSESVARCRKLATGAAAATSPPRRATKSAPPRTSRPAPRPAATKQPSQAVERLRMANDAAEIEANERLAVKDEVDARLANWKAGKEANLRALIASLDLVLWPGLGWKKVGMGELLTEGQVKVKYVRAIAKVHPDKIPKDATVEQQMIAKSVFASLNEAWIAMQG